jgi:dTMP kinase
MNNMGYIVSFEGIDYSGKSTQINLLETYLKEFKIDYDKCYALGGTKISDSICSMLLDIDNELYPLTELYLFMASRHQIVKEVIEPAILKSKLVILDRYIDSSIVYQGYVNGVNIELVEALNKASVYSFEPDLTFLIDISQETFLKRLDNDICTDRIENNLKDSYDKINFGYHKILESNKRIKLINGEQSISDIHQDIVVEINNLLGI